MKILKNLLSKHTKALIVVPILISLAVGTGIFKITIKDDVVAMLPKDLPERLVLQELEANFGASEFINVTIGKKGSSVFNYTTLSKLARITEKLEEVPFISRVRSLSNASETVGNEFGLDVYPLMEEVPRTPAELKKLENSVFNNSELVGSLISEDKQYLAIYIFLSLERVDSSVAYNTVKNIAYKEIGPERIYISGVPVIAGIIGKAIRNDLVILIPLVILVLVFILYVGLRNKRGVLLVLIIILLSVLPVIGLMGYLKMPFMVVNSAMPIILLALSCAYSIHIIMKFYSAFNHKKTKTETVHNTMDELFLPITATSLTTIVGFLSLATSPLPILFEFGLLVSAGILWAWVLSITTLPALLIVLPLPKIAGQGIMDEKGFFSKVARGFSRLTVKYKIPVIIFYIIITAVFIFGLTRLRIESRIDRFFSKSSPIRISDRISGEHFGGSANLSIIIEGDINNPAILNDILDLQEYLKTIEGIGSTTSIADVICLLNKALHNNNPEFRKIPDTPEGVSQLILLYSMSGDPEDFAMLINSDSTLTHMNIRMASMYSIDVKRILNKINNYIPKNFSSDIKYRITGSSILTMQLSEMTAISSIKSILISITAVFIICLFLYRSIAFGLLNIIPLSITMIIIFGFMGFAKIDFSIEIAIICSIIIGVGIDYALHYTSKYCLLANKMTQEETAIAVINETGPPILSNATSIALGFLILPLSLIIPIKSLGLLVSISMLMAAIVTLTVLSSILIIVKPKVRHKTLIFEKEKEA